MSTWNEIRKMREPHADRLPKTVRKNQIYQFIKRYWMEFGESPSLQEIGEGIVPPLSRSVVSRYLREMAAANIVQRGISVSRTYRPKGADDDSQSEASNE